MSKEMLKDIIDIVPDKDIEILFQVILKFIPEDMATNEELELIKKAKEENAKYGTVSHKDIKWD